MSLSNCPCPATPEDKNVDCGEETCAQAICRHQRYIDELFKRTEWLKSQLTGSSSEPFSIAYASDAGAINEHQDNLAFHMINGDPDIYLFGGDNNYPDGAQGTIDANWAAFNDQISQNMVVPALGDRDLNTDPLGGPQTNKFLYLPGNRRYYHIYYENASLDIFVLNSGMNSAFSLVEPDGNTVGSVQHSWFLNEISNSVGLFKIVVFHHPFVSGVDNAIANNRVVEEMNWRFDLLGVDLILNGHTGTAQHLISNGLNILDVSASVNAVNIMDAGGIIYGSQSANTQLIWGYGDPGFAGPRAYSTIDISNKTLIATVRRIDNGNPVHAFSIIK